MVFGKARSCETIQCEIFKKFVLILFAQRSFFTSAVVLGFLFTHGKIFGGFVFAKFPDENIYGEFYGFSVGCFHD